MNFQPMKFAPKSQDEMITIQKELFKLGYLWGIHGNTVCYSDRPYLYTSETGKITYGSEEYCFNSSSHPFATIELKVVFTIPETVEVYGKRYLKTDIEAALAKLTPAG